MELREGFIKNDIGVIPKDWKIKNIGSICDIYGRIGFRGYTIKDIVPKEEGAITISPSNIQDGKMDFTKCTYISWFKYEESPEIKIFNGDILLVKTGSTFGKTAIIKDLHEEATINPQLVVLKNIKVDNVFLGYIMAYKIVQNQIKSTIVGGAIPTLSQQVVANYKVPLPPTKSEQTAIATVLSDADALICSLEKLIEKKLNIKQGAIQQLLKPKKGWVVKKIKYLSEYIAVGFVGSMSNLFTDQGIPLLRGLNIVPGSLDMSVLKYISFETHKSWKKSNLIQGDLVMVRVGYPGTATVIPEGLGDLNAASLVIVRPNKKFIDANYLCYYINSHGGKLEIQNMLVGGAQQVFNTGTAAELEIPLPQTKAEQTEIAKILLDMDNEISSLEKELSKSKMLKQGIMQELLTGKIRLVKYG